MRYYSTQRPITPGSYPKPAGNQVTDIHNYDQKTYCKEIGREAWGYIEYEFPLAESETQNWELAQESITWYPVTVSSRKHGGGLRVFSGQIKRVVQRPADTKGDTKKMQFKTRYFNTWTEAQRVMNVIQALSITIERVRMSATQGEVKVFINGEYILSFGDEIILPERNADSDTFYGDDIGGWRSSKPDSDFVLGLIWPPLDYAYHYSDLVCKKLGIKSEDWIER